MARRLPRPSEKRGAALLIAIVSIAIITALTVDLAYQTRVTLQASANARDELRAEWQARSGIGFSRLVLHFQQQLDQAAGAAGQAGGLAGLAGGAGGLGGAAGLGGAGGLGALAGALGGAGQPAAGAAAGAGSPLAGLGGGLPLSIRLWSLVPVDSNVAGMLLGEDAPRDAEDEAPARDPGADGSFEAKIEDEDGKINIRQLNGLGALPAAQAARLSELVNDPRYDFLFDEEDANGIRVTRRDLLGYLRDWADEDDVTSVFTGNPLQPFEPGFADENGIYQRLDDRYQTKNAWFDSLHELYLVAGVSDAFMEAFGDSLTVYPDVNAPININAADRVGLLVNALVMSDPPGIPQPPFLDPAFEQQLDAALLLVRPLPFMSMTPQQFATALQTLGIRVQQIYTQGANTDSRAAFGARSTTFRIRATGRSGAVTKHLDAVVTFDQRAGPLAQDLGRVIHWNEE